MSVQGTDHRVGKKGKKLRSFLNFLHLPGGKSRRKNDFALSCTSSENTTLHELIPQTDERVSDIYEESSSFCQREVNTLNDVCLQNANVNSQNNGGDFQNGKTENGSTSTDVSNEYVTMENDTDGRTTQESSSLTASADQPVASPSTDPDEPSSEPVFHEDGTYEEIPERSVFGRLTHHYTNVPASILFNESYFEDDYWQDFRDVLTSHPTSSDDEAVSVDVEGCSEDALFRMRVSSLNNSQQEAIEDGSDESSSFERFSTSRSVVRRRPRYTSSVSRNSRESDSSESSLQLPVSRSESTSVPVEGECISLPDDGIEIFDDSGLIDYGQLKPELFSWNIVVDQTSFFSDTNNCHPTTPFAKVQPRAHSTQGKDHRSIVKADVHANASNSMRCRPKQLFAADCPSPALTEKSSTPALQTGRSRKRSRSLDNFPLSRLCLERGLYKTTDSLNTQTDSGKIMHRLLLENNSLDRAFVLSNPQTPATPNSTNFAMGRSTSEILSRRTPDFPPDRNVRVTNAQPDATAKRPNANMKPQRLRIEDVNLSFPASSDSDLSPEDFLPQVIKNQDKPVSSLRLKVGHRRSIESGYGSSKPASPEPPTTKFTLSSLRMSSPAIRNRLDGLNSPKGNCPRLRQSFPKSALKMKLTESKERVSPVWSNISGVSSTSEGEAERNFRDVVDGELARLPESLVEKWLESYSDDLKPTQGEHSEDSKGNMGNWLWSEWRNIDFNNNQVIYHLEKEAKVSTESQSKLKMTSNTTPEKLSENPNANIATPSHKDPVNTCSRSSGPSVEQPSRPSQMVNHSPCGKFRLPHPLSASSPMTKTASNNIAKKARPTPAPMSPVPEDSEGVSKPEAKPRRKLKRMSKNRGPLDFRGDKLKTKKHSSDSNLGEETDKRNSSESDEESKWHSSKKIPKQTNSRQNSRRTGVTSGDYVILQKAAYFLISRISDCKSMEKLLDLAAVINYFYSVVKSNKNVSIDGRTVPWGSINTHRTRTVSLTLQNCIDLLTLSCIQKCGYMLKECATFAFGNIRKLATRPEFLACPPEIVVYIITQKDTMVLNSQGFPMNFHCSELQILRAVEKYILANPLTGSAKKRQCRLFLKSCALSALFIKPTAGGSPAGERESNPSSSPTATSGKSGCILRKCQRMFYNVDFVETKQEQHATDTRQEYLFQPFLSEGEVNQTTEEPGESLCTGSSQTENDYLNDHTILRRLFFSFRRHNKMPHITGVAMQYSNQGKKSVVRIGSPVLKKFRRDGQGSSSSEKNVESSSTDSASSGSPISEGQHNRDDSPLSNCAKIEAAASDDAKDNTGLTCDLEGPIKTTCLSLGPGEHVTGVAVQGISVIHNIQVTTSHGRRVLAHGLGPETCAPWHHLPKPEGNTEEGLPFCLQTLRATVCKPSTRPYLRDVSVVWAVIKVPPTEAPKEVTSDGKPCGCEVCSVVGVR